MTDETLGNWLDANALRGRFRDLPAGELGNDITAAALEECKRHLASVGKTIPENGAVPATHRQAQLLFAKTLVAERATNPDAETAGTLAAQVPLYSWRKRARDLLGTGFLVG